MLHENDTCYLCMTDIYTCLHQYPIACLHLFVVGFVAFSLSGLVACTLVYYTSVLFTSYSCLSILCRPLFWSMDYVELNRTFDQWYGRKSCVLRSALFTCTVLSLSHDLLVPVNRSNVSDEVESAKQDVYRRQALVRQAS